MTLLCEEYSFDYRNLAPIRDNFGSNMEENA
jgi:hypothetical protein